MKKIFTAVTAATLCLFSVVCFSIGASTANSERQSDATQTQTETATTTDADGPSTTATEEQKETRIDASVAATLEEESWEPTTTTVRQNSTTLTTEPKLVYTSKSTQLTSIDVETLAALLYLEGGGTSWNCQVAICSSILNLYDAIKLTNGSYTFYEHCHSTARYSPAESISETTPNQMQYDVIEAVLGGERIDDVMYFYAIGLCNSSWHETQKFVCQFDGVKFFTRWN